MKQVRTISGRTLQVSPNHQKRTFTIRTESAKFRTYKQSENEFLSNLENTGNDWQDFLKSNDYYKVN